MLGRGLGTTAQFGPPAATGAASGGAAAALLLSVLRGLSWPPVAREAVASHALFAACEACECEEPAAWAAAALEVAQALRESAQHTGLLSLTVAFILGCLCGPLIDLLYLGRAWIRRQVLALTPRSAPRYAHARRALDAQ